MSDSSGGINRWDPALLIEIMAVADFDLPLPQSKISFKDSYYAVASFEP
jgi:hypothetical protein